MFAGTLAPLISDALGLGTLSVGPPYFNPTFMLSMLPLLALLSSASTPTGSAARLCEQHAPLHPDALAAAVLGCVIVFGIFTGGQVLTPVGDHARHLDHPVLAGRPDRSLAPRSCRCRARVIGMTDRAHRSRLFVSPSRRWSRSPLERDVALAPGESRHVGDYEFRFEGVEADRGPELRRRAAARSSVTPRRPAGRGAAPREAPVLGAAHQVTTEAAHRDAPRQQRLFVALGDDLGAGSWSVRFQVRPLVNFVWLAAFIMALGGMLAHLGPPLPPADGRGAGDRRRSRRITERAG